MSYKSILDLVDGRPSNVNNREMADRNSKKSHYIRSKEKSLFEKDRYTSQIYFT